MTQIKINTNQIGDDNDYSCFLHNVVFNLWIAGHTEQAFLLCNTDTMLGEQFTEQSFAEYMESQKTRRAEMAAEDKATKEHYDKLFRD